MFQSSWACERACRYGTGLADDNLQRATEQSNYADIPEHFQWFTCCSTCPASIGSRNRVRRGRPIRLMTRPARRHHDHGTCRQASFQFISYRSQRPANLSNVLAFRAVNSSDQACRQDREGLGRPHCSKVARPPISSRVAGGAVTALIAGCSSLQGSVRVWGTDELRWWERRLQPLEKARQAVFL